MFKSRPVPFLCYTNTPPIVPSPGGPSTSTIGTCGCTKTPNDVRKDIVWNVISNSVTFKCFVHKSISIFFQFMNPYYCWRKGSHSHMPGHWYWLESFHKCIYPVAEQNPKHRGLWTVSKASHLKRCLFNLDNFETNVETFYIGALRLWTVPRGQCFGIRSNPVSIVWFFIFRYY